MTVQDIVGRYAILGNNQDKLGTEYHRVLTLSLDAHQKNYCCMDDQSRSATIWYWFF